MIVICDKAQDIVIPAGLGDNAGVVYEKSGVESLNGQQGDLTLKTVNGNELLGEGDVAIDTGVESLNGQTGAVKIKSVNGTDMLGEGDVAIDTGVESLNGQKGALTLKTVNGNELTGEGNIEIQAGVESVNGETGAVKIKSVNGQSLVGDGDVQIQAGLKYFELTADKAKEAYEEVINHWDSLSGYTGDYVFTYNNRKGNIANYYFVKITHIDDATGNYVLFSCVDTDAGFNYRDSTIKIFSVIVYNNNNGANYNLRTYYNTFTIPDKVSQLTNDSEFQTKSQVDFAIANAISGVSGDQNVIVLDGLTQEERKAVYDKLDKTKAPDEVFVYEGKTSVRAYWGGGNYLKFITFNDSYDGLKVVMYSLNPDGNLGYEDRGMTYTNSVLMHLGNHVDESGYFECMYIGNFFEYILRPYTRPNACFINLEKGIGDSTRPIYAPVSTLVEKYGERTNVRMQFFANEKLYTFLLDANQDNKWIFESAKPITGGGSGESPKTYYFFNDPTRDPNAPNAHNVEVFRAFDKAVQEGGAFNNFYIVNGNETSGQTPLNPILQVTKMEAADNGVWGGNKGYYVFAGQKSNVETEKLQVHKYCLTDIGGVIDFMVNAVDGGTWTSGVHSKIDDVLTAGQDIPFVFEYLEGCDETYFWADNMGGKQGLYNITFNGGYDGYKGNVVADVYGNGTGVYMAFTVNNVRYTYKKNDTSNKWELAKSVQIGGVQSTEVSSIKVLTQSEYDALEPKDPNTMYCIKG